MTNWKTTLTGLIVIACGVYLIVKGTTEAGIPVVIAGVGLLCAKDSDVTGSGPNATRV